jgi:uncharacterized protein
LTNFSRRERTSSTDNWRDPPQPDATEIADGVLSFVSLLRRRGARIDVQRVEDAIHALEYVNLDEPAEAYWALRCVLTQRQQDLAIFDAVLRDLLREPKPGENRDADADEGAASGASSDPDAIGDEDKEFEQGFAWSPDELLRRLDFAEYGPEELRRTRTLVRTIAMSLPQQTKRRRRPSSTRRHLDVRRTVHAAVRTGGLPLTQEWSNRHVGPRKLLLLVDVSGSMQTTSLVVLMFAQAAVRADHRVEAFAFGTRLTRLTRHLRGQDMNEAMLNAAADVVDWGGGTRIAGSLGRLNSTWAPRGVARGAVVVIVSDGLEHDDAAQLAREMVRLRRTAHAIVWVNPLAGDADYEPLAAGMAAALPHVDYFLPGHNLDALSSLVGVLAAIPRRRSQIVRS